MKRMMLAGSAVAALVSGFAAPAMAADAVAVAGAPAAGVQVPNNVLLADWTGPYEGVPPWDKVAPALFPQAFQFAIDEQRREYQAVANNPEPPTFANTIEATERAGQRLPGEPGAGRVGRQVDGRHARPHTWSPHSVLSRPAQRPALGSSPGATRRVHGRHPMDG